MLPEGQVTYLFTDLEASTRLWEEHPDAMGDALAHHDRILREAVLDHRGSIVKTTGDGVHAVFVDAVDAVDAAVAAQVRLGSVAWGSTGPLVVRMGCNSGDAELRDGDYYGPAVNRAARVMAAAHGGQVLLSEATADLVRDRLPVDVAVVDLGEHRLRDLARAEHVFQVVHPALTAEFPPLRSLESYPTNLPAQRTSFVGRDSEHDVVADLLRQSSVVTVTGVGGVGKSRLAVQVAATLLPRFPDGAWLCELASVTDEGAVADVVAESVRVPAGSGPARDALPWHLRERRALLVIDNCEHLIGAVAELVDDLCARCPDVRILCTSREALGVHGERTFALGTLLLPDGTDPRSVLASPAGRLFVERAQAARHDYTLGPEDSPAVAELCGHLDGIPLAIELAAARIRSLSPDQMLDRIDERFRLLTGGSKARGRHQTLRGALAWSTDLLEPAERDAFGRLSVFVAPFDLTAAETVIGDAAWEILDALVDKSLVLAEHGDAEVRYRMLETVREFASDLLVERGDVADARARHARHYTLVAEAAAAVATFESVEVVRRDLRNVVAALTWSTTTGDVDRACSIVLPFESMYLFREQGVGRLLDRALAVPGALEHPLAPRLMAAAASRAVSRGEDPDVALARADASLALAADLGVDVAYEQHLNLAVVDMRVGRLDQAVEHSNEALVLAYPDALRRMRVWLVLSAIEQWRGDSGAAVRAAHEAVTRAREAGDEFDVAYALLLEGYVHAGHDPDRALAAYTESASIAAGLLPAGLSVYVFSIANAAVLRAGREAPSTFLPELERVVALAAADGTPEEYATVLALTGLTLLALGRAEEAVVVMAAATARFPVEQLVRSAGQTADALQERLVAELGDERANAAFARGGALTEREARDVALGALAGVVADP